MITYPPALRSTGFVAPKAIAHFGLAVMEARAAESGRAMESQALPRRSRTEPRPRPEPFRPRRRTVIRLWLPLTPLFLLLSPFALLLTPLVWLAPSPYGDRPLATVLGIGRLLLSLSGTDVDVDAPDARVRIKIL